ncbi:IPT/TIG domain-containing protein [Actinoplanes aureus]|uniref:IPT/TIG domain-containing protein n=1 Tax=Actinoplanes aureus TaxID=2792083 RepID=A0A931C300_9ACTN|nr:IPT/TIG domain-containing protein [Actinoplanes aureus]MBG0560166.1 IPT/TIG domain-containing protein [Actinoplanes aureus]
MRKSKTRIETRRAVRAGLATAATAVVVLGATALPAQAAAVTLTLSNASGANTGGNSFTGTSTTPWLTGYTAPVAYFGQAACQQTWTTARYSSNVLPSASNTGIVAAETTKKVSNNKVAVSIKAAAAGTTGANIDLSDYGAAGGTTRYNVCIYGSATDASPLVGTASYSVVAAATLAAISPTSGPAMGGTQITVTGTNLPTTAGSITATLGGLPLTVQPGANNYFTATVPKASPQNDADLIIETTAGTLRMNDAFDFVNGTTVTPNTAPSTRNFVDIDMYGSGFLNYTFGWTLPDAKVYLVNGNYNPADSANKKTRPQTSECIDVLVIDDTELICTLVLSQTTADATLPSATTENDANYTTGGTTIAAANATTAIATLGGTTTLTVPGGGLTQADVGEEVTGLYVDEAVDAAIAADTVITAVNAAGTVATLSTAGTIGTSGNFHSITIGADARATTGISIAAIGSRTVTSATPMFYAGDVGDRIIDATEIAPGTVITAVASDRLSATISKPALGTLSAVATTTIQPSTPVPDGSYNLTVVSSGSRAAQTASTYLESVVASGSSFTVAEF